MLRALTANVLALEVAAQAGQVCRAALHLRAAPTEGAVSAVEAAGRWRARRPHRFGGPSWEGGRPRRPASPPCLRSSPRGGAHGGPHLTRQGRAPHRGGWAALPLKPVARREERPLSRLGPSVLRSRCEAQARCGRHKLLRRQLALAEALNTLCKSLKTTLLDPPPRYHQAWHYYSTLTFRPWRSRRLLALLHPKAACRGNVAQGGSRLNLPSAQNRACTRARRGAGSFPPQRSCRAFSGLPKACRGLQDAGLGPQNMLSGARWTWYLVGQSGEPAAAAATRHSLRRLPLPADQFPMQSRQTTAVHRLSSTHQFRRRHAGHPIAQRTALHAWLCRQNLQKGDSLSSCKACIQALSET